MDKIEYELHENDITNADEYVEIELDKEEYIEIDPISGLDANKYPNLTKQYNEDGAIGVFKNNIK